MKHPLTAIIIQFMTRVEDYGGFNLQKYGQVQRLENMSDSNIVSRSLKDIKILVEVSERALSTYEYNADLVDMSVIVNQQQVLKYYRDMLHAKEKELEYNKGAFTTSEK